MHKFTIYVFNLLKMDTMTFIIVPYMPCCIIIRDFKYSAAGLQYTSYCKPNFTKLNRQ